MATDRVGIYIDLMGYKEAMENMQNLDGMIKGLKGRKNYVKIKAEIDKLKMNREALRNNKVKLKADMTQVDKEIKRVKNSIRSLEKSKALYKPNSKAWNDLAARIGRLKNELAGLEGKRVTLGDQFRQTTAEINESTAAINRLNASIKNAGLAGKSLGQIFRSVSSGTAHLGSAMQSMGNAITRLTTPLRMMGTGALMGAGYGALNKVTEGLKSGFSRYDTMKKYPRMMQTMGYASEDAEKSIEKLNQAVLGLPTGLDEIVDVAQRYTLTVGDIEKGTDLAIAANNAFLASMSTETQKYQGMMQLQDLLNGKKLRSTEWNSLIGSMSAGINAVGKELGYADDEMDTFRQDLLANDIAGEKFLDALVKVGTGTGQLVEMANLSKDTWEAFTINVGTAFSRMTYGILTNMDEIVKSLGMVDKDGNAIESLNQLFSDKIITGIDKMSESVKGWIDAHPDEIKDFFSDLASIDWKGLGKGFVEGIGEIAGLVQKVAGLIEGHSLEGAGKWIARLNLIGNGLLIFGGLFKGGRGIIAGAATGIVGLVRGLAGLGSIKGIEKLGKIGGFLKKIAGLGAAAEGAGAAGAAAGAAGGTAGAAAIIKGFVPIITAIAGIGAVVTEIAAIAAIDTAIFSKAVDNMVEITSGMQQVFNNVKTMKGEFTAEQADALRESINNMYSIYDILYGEKSNAGQRTRGANKSTGGFGQQREDGLHNMNKWQLSKIADSMESISQIVGAMKDIMPKLQELSALNAEVPIANLTGDFGVIGKMQKLYTALDGAFSGGTGVINIESKMESMSNAVTSLKKAVTKMSALGTGDMAGTDSAAFTAIENIKTFMSKLGTALNTEGLASLQEQVATFKEAVTDIFDTLNSDFSSIDVEVHINGKVTGADELISEIRAVNGKIRAAVRGIQTSWTRYVTIHVKPSVSVGDYSVPDLGYPHTGGYIAGPGKLLYRKHGGDVGHIFKPKGTDTVPAMLTPGEYVQRKAAVDYFGVKFMQKINNLDVKGAMRELSARAGMRATASRGTTIYNNVTNNSSPTINQNINTNNPNFAFRRTSRYVAAL